MYIQNIQKYINIKKKLKKLKKVGFYPLTKFLGYIYKDRYS